jgi:hypothetical protein
LWYSVVVSLVKSHCRNKSDYQRMEMSFFLCHLLSKDLLDWDHSEIITKEWGFESCL